MSKKNIEKIEGLRKSEVVESITGWSKPKIQQELREVIQELRKVSEKEARDTKTVKPSEFEELQKRYR